MSPENAAIYKARIGGDVSGIEDDARLALTVGQLDAMFDAVRAEGEFNGRAYGLRNESAIVMGDRRVGVIFARSAPEVAHRCVAGIGLEVAIKGHDFEFGVYPIPARPAPTSIEERLARVEATAHPPVSIEEILDRKLGNLGDRLAALEAAKAPPATSEDEFATPTRAAYGEPIKGEKVDPNPPTTAGSRLAAALFAGQGHPSRLPYVDDEDLEDAVLDGHFNLEAAAAAFLEAEGRKHTITLKADMSAVLDGVEGLRYGLAARPAPCDVCGKPGQFRAGMTFATCDDHGEPIVRGFAEKGIDPAGWKLVKDGPAEGLTVRATMKFDEPGDAERRERELLDSVTRHPIVTAEGPTPDEVRDYFTFRHGGRRGPRPWDRFYSRWGPRFSIGPGAPRSRR